MRTIEGIKCRTRWESSQHSTRFVEIYSKPLPGWFCIGHIRLEDPDSGWSSKEWHFVVFGWLFSSKQPVIGTRSTMKECLETMIIQYLEYDPSQRIERSTK